jgi:NifB/MoaA-like Fe-S oxidoreductase
MLARIFAELSALTGVGVQVVPVRNEHFGARINVSGLLTGKDIVATLAQEALGEVVLLPRTALDYFGRKFLDDTTPADVECALGRPVLFASALSDVVEQLDRFASGVRPEPVTPAATNGILWAAR